MRRLLTALFGAAALATSAPLIVTQTVTPGALAAALGGGGGLTVNSVAITNGAPSQFGTYTGFSSGPVTIGDGVVLSTGQVVQVLPAFNNGLQGAATTPSTDTGQPGTAAFNSYGTGHITNFATSNDVAALQVNFTLSAPTQVGFNFIFGSVEFPQFTSSFTDAFLAFLDGTATSNQIVFDASNNAVQVGTTFASALLTTDTNTAFAGTHGLVPLTTFTVGNISAGSHTLVFEIGDVNDHILDSAVFINNLHGGAGDGGTHPTAPDPVSLILIGSGLLGLAIARRRLAA